MIRCLLANIGHAAVPAEWSFLEHVGHFGGDRHVVFTSWALEQCLHTVKLEHDSSGWPKVQHFLQMYGLGMYFLITNLS